MAADIIRNAILEGRLLPGERVGELDLARELGVSRTPIREALLMLAQQGLVDSDPHRGSTVKSYTADELDDIYQLRANLEGYGANRAAHRVTTKDAEILREACVRFERIELANVTEHVRENLFFHDYVLDIAGSARLKALVHQFIELPLVYKSYFWRNHEQARIAASYHERILDALIAHDAERAGFLMQAHILESRDYLIDVLHEDSGLAAERPVNLQENDRVKPEAVE